MFTGQTLTGCTEQTSRNQLHEVDTDSKTKGYNEFYVVEIGNRYFVKYAENTGHLQTAWSIGGAKIYSTIHHIPKNIARLGNVRKVICHVTRP